MALLACGQKDPGASAPATAETPAEVAAEQPAPPAEEPAATPAPATRFEPVEVARFDEPWAMTFLPDGRLLVTEKGGAIKLMSEGGKLGEVTGAPRVDHGGQAAWVTSCSIRASTRTGSSI